MHPCSQQCGHPAVIIDRETALPWCLGCATAFVKAGSPVIEYIPLEGAEAYEQLLDRGTTQTLRFPTRRNPARP